MLPEHLIVRTSLSDELYFFQWPKSGPGSSRVEAAHYNWQSCSQARSTKFGYRNWFDLKLVGCGLEYGLLVTLQNMFDVSPIHCFWCLRIIEFCIYKSLMVVSQNPWFVYLQIIDFCTYKSLGFVPTNPWFLYLQFIKICTAFWGPINIRSTS